MQLKAWRYTLQNRLRGLRVTQRLLQNLKPLTGMLLHMLRSIMLMRHFLKSTMFAPVLKSITIPSGKCWLEKLMRILLSMWRSRIRKTVQMLNHLESSITLYCLTDRKLIFVTCLQRLISPTIKITMVLRILAVGQAIFAI